MNDACICSVSARAEHDGRKNVAPVVGDFCRVPHLGIRHVCDFRFHFTSPGEDERRRSGRCEGDCPVLSGTRGGRRHICDVCILVRLSASDPRIKFSCERVFFERYTRITIHLILLRWSTLYTLLCTFVMVFSVHGQSMGIIACHAHLNTPNE